MRKYMLFIAVAVAALIVSGMAAASVKDGTGYIYRDTNHDCVNGGYVNNDLVGAFSETQGTRGRVSGTVTLYSNSNLAPNSSFNVTLYENPPCYGVHVGTLHTDADGHGVFKFSVTLAHKNVTDVFVTLKRDTSNHVLTSESVEVYSY